MAKVITDWLKRNYNVKRFGPPTWKALVEAVQATTGGYKALAEKIAKLHPATGKEILQSYMIARCEIIAYSLSHSASIAIGYDHRCVNYLKEMMHRLALNY